MRMMLSLFGSEVCLSAVTPIVTWYIDGFFKIIPQDIVALRKYSEKFNHEYNLRLSSNGGSCFIELPSGLVLEDFIQEVRFFFKALLSSMPNTQEIEIVLFGVLEDSAFIAGKTILAIMDDPEYRARSTSPRFVALAS